MVVPDDAGELGNTQGNSVEGVACGTQSHLQHDGWVPMPRLSEREPTAADINEPRVGPPGSHSLCLHVCYLLRRAWRPVPSTYRHLPGDTSRSIGSLCAGRSNSVIPW